MRRDLAAAAVKRSPLARRAPLKARAPLSAGQALARGTARLKARRRPAAGTVEQRERFKLEVCDGATCAVLDDGPCDGHLEAHHVVPQEWLRKNFAAQGPDVLAAVLWNPANGLAVCERHHRRHTLATRRIPLAVLSTAHARFIDIVGADLLVGRTYRRLEDLA